MWCDAHALSSSGGNSQLSNVPQKTQLCFVFIMPLISPHPLPISPGQCLGTSGDRFPGLPVGSHSDQLLTHHHRHPRPVRHYSVQTEIRHRSEFLHTFKSRHSWKPPFLYFTFSVSKLTTASHLMISGLWILLEWHFNIFFFWLKRRRRNICSFQGSWHWIKTVSLSYHSLTS